MRKLSRQRPSGSLVISCLALFVALGSTSWAAIVITGKNVKNGSLTQRDVKNGSLTGRDVKNRSLTGADVRGDSLSARQINESSLGKVPAAADADRAASAGRAGTATSAGTASNAEKLGGVGPEGFLQVKDRIALGSRIADSLANYTGGASLVNYGVDRGGYLVQARVAIDNDGGVTELVTCRILVDNVEKDALALNVGPNGNDIRLFSLVTTIAQPNPSAQLELNCDQPAGNDNDAFRAKLYSIRNNN